MNINLGLVEREYADTSVEKDLTEATVVVGGKVLTYKFNSSIDFDKLTDEELEELLYKQIAVADANIEYSIGIYSSDYYYRSSIYEGTEFYDDLANLYGGSISNSELEIYLTYTIVVHNESETYEVEINELADYTDETLTLVTDASSTNTYVYSMNGEDINESINLAEAPTVTYYDSNGSATSTGKVTWSSSTEEEDITNGVVYNKRTTSSLDGTKIAAGGTAEIVSTYKVNKTATDEYGISDLIELGEKHNIAEVTNFSSYYTSNSRSEWKVIGANTGRVDKDSAPDNINIAELNFKTYYEDDTDASPILDIELVDEDREINGLVWEDAQTDTVEYSQVIGNGYYNSDEGDKLIEGLTTELVEVISIPTGETDSDGNAIYKEYDFIWPTETYMFTTSDGDTISLGDITGLHSSTTTDSSGQYLFTGISSGNYKVRFVYGDTEVLTGNEGYEEVYNGQDYKSTTYQAGYSSDTDSDGDGYTDDAWYDLDNEELNLERVSDAKDSEARRLVVAAKSEILIYDNTSVLATADDADADHSELFGYGKYTDSSGTTTEIVTGYEAAKEVGDVVSGSWTEIDSEGNTITKSLDDDDKYEYSDDLTLSGSTGYYMYAETAKIKLEIENTSNSNYATVTDSNGSIVSYIGTISYDAVSTGNDYTYEISNIDFGLEERSQTELTLDKQIKEITLTTSDGEIILDAVYDIEYELGDDDTIKSSVTLNKWESTNYDQIASLNRSSGTQGYRYIMTEGTILQGATINVTYQLTVFNVGEADTCNVILTEIWDEINTKGTSNKYEEALAYLTSPYYTVDGQRLVCKDNDSGDIITDVTDYTNTIYSSIYEYGLYFGSIYYLGVDGSYTSPKEDYDEFGTYTEYGYTNMLVESTIHQIIDYIDPDVEFIDTDNLSVNQSWSTTTIDYLIANKLIDPEAIIVVDSDGNPVLKCNSSSGYTEEVSLADIISYDSDGNINIDLNLITKSNGYSANGEGYAFLSNEVQQYITDTKNNVVVSIDDGSSSVNPSLVKTIVPYSAEENYDDATASITLEVSRYYSSEEDANEIDNIAEIIKVENTVGRRDIRTVAGNTITYQIDWDTVDEKTYTNEEDIYTTTVSLYEIAGEEPDVSATEVITLTPPTGLDTTVDKVMKILAITGCVGVILALGIVFIKKKLKRKYNT